MAHTQVVSVIVLRDGKDLNAMFQPMTVSLPIVQVVDNASLATVIANQDGKEKSVMKVTKILSFSKTNKQII